MRASPFASHLRIEDGSRDGQATAHRLRQHLQVLTRRMQHFDATAIEQKVPQRSEVLDRQRIEHHALRGARCLHQAQGRVVVSVNAEQHEEFIELLATSETEFSLLGKVSSGELQVDEASFGTISKSRSVYDNVLHNILGE